jgi:hypothetical protein
MTRWEPIPSVLVGPCVWWQTFPSMPNHFTIFVLIAVSLCFGDQARAQNLGEELFFRIPISNEGCQMIARGWATGKTGAYERVAVIEIQDQPIAEELLARRYGLRSKTFRAVVLDQLYLFTGGKEKFPVVSGDPEFKEPLEIRDAEFAKLKEQVGRLINNFIGDLENNKVRAPIVYLGLFQTRLEAEPSKELPINQQLSDLISAFQEKRNSVLERTVVNLIREAVEVYYENMFAAYNGNFLRSSVDWSSEGYKFRR